MSEPGAAPTRPIPEDEDEGESPLAREVARFREREEAKKTRKLAVVALIVGSLGWIIVLPALAGMYCGHELDHACHSGVAFTAAGLLVGVALGFLVLWRSVADRGGKS